MNIAGIIGALVMGCTPTLSTGLVEFWQITQVPPGQTQIPGGSVQMGGHDNNIELTLDRTNRDTGADMSVATGYTFEPSPSLRPCFNGGGRADISGAGLSLAAGNAVTIAVRFWPGGGAIQGGSQPAKPIQILGLGGQRDANPTVETGASVEIPDPTAAPAALRLRRYNGGSPLFNTFAGVTPPSLPLLLIVVFRGLAGGVACEAYIDGAHAGDVAGLIPAAAFDLDHFTVGDMVESDGAWSQVALWTRALTAGEIAIIGEDMDCFPSLPPAGGGGPGSEDPLLDPEGRSRVFPRWITPRRDGIDVLATAGAQRHTRRLSERVPREYDLVFDPINQAEYEILMSAIETSAHGALPTRWRHPKDDAAGPVSTAPRWRILNANEAERLIVERRRGGNPGALTLRIREVV